MPVMHHFESVDAYIAGQPQNLQTKLEALRETIKKAAPNAAESISYGMPAYKYLGRPLVYFAAYKTHIGFYALPKAVALFKEQLSDYSISKGTIRFPLDKPLPLQLIKTLVKYRVEENKALSEKKTSAKTQKAVAKKKTKPAI